MINNSRPMSDLSLIYEQYRKVINEAMPFAAPEEGFGQPEHITRHKTCLLYTSDAADE